MSDYPDQTRNLNPTPEARWAMGRWAMRYGEQLGGSMDFWDSLTVDEQHLASKAVAEILEAAINHGRVRPALSKDTKG